jgi:hypothetical protein
MDAAGVPLPVRVIIASTFTVEGPISVGVTQVPGTVTTAADSALTVAGVISQLQRVLMLCAGPSWSYKGRVLLQLPLLT